MKFQFILILGLLLLFGCSVNNDLIMSSEADKLSLQQINEELLMTNSSDDLALVNKSLSEVNSMASMNKILSELNSQDRTIARGDDKGVEFTFMNKFTCEFSDVPGVIQAINDTLSIEGFENYEIYTRKDSPSGNWIVNIIGDKRKLESVVLHEFN